MNAEPNTGWDPAPHAREGVWDKPTHDVEVCVSVRMRAAGRPPLPTPGTRSTKVDHEHLGAELELLGHRICGDTLVEDLLLAAQHHSMSTMDSETNVPGILALMYSPDPPLREPEQSASSFS